jgi:ATP-dependent Lon protease
MNSIHIDKYIKEYLKLDNNNINKDDLIYSFKYQAFNELLHESIDNLNDKGEKVVDFLSKLISRNLITIKLFEENTNEQLNNMVEGLNMNLSKKAKLNHIITLNFLNNLINDLINDIVENKNKSKLCDMLSQYKNANIDIRQLKVEDDKSKKRKKFDDDEYKNDDNSNSDSDYSTSEDEAEKQKLKNKKKASIIKIIKINPQYNKKQRMNEFLNELYNTKNTNSNQSAEIEKYYSTLSEEEQISSNNTLKDIINYESKETPAVFKIMNMPIELSQRNHILKQYNSLLYGRSENKLRTWFDSLMNIPFGKYKGIDLHSIKSSDVKKFLNKLQKNMDSAVYGHDDAKRIIIQMMAQQIKNPNCKGSVLGIWGSPGNGKCFALNTPILMHDGTIKKVQDINIGDVLMGDDSKPRNVLSLGSGEDEMYEILSNKGDSYTVNSDHILCLKSSGLNKICKKNDKFKAYYFKKNTYNYHTKIFNNKNDAQDYLNSLMSKETDDVVEITVKNYLKLSNDIKSKLKGYKTGVEFQTKEVDFDPYIIGLWLGDETSAKSEITTQDSRILYYVREKLKKYNLNLKYSNGYTYTIVSDIKQNTQKSMNKFNNVLKHHNLFNNKHIPDDYKINDRNTRLQILAGLIDTNGYYNKTMKNFEITQKSKRLSDDIVYLANSLGFRASQNEVSKSMYKGEKKEGTYYLVIIYGDGLEEIPTLCTRKQYIKSERQKNALVSGITVIPKGRGNYYGFMIDGNERFVMGDFTVTHNTSIIKEGIAKAMDKPFVFISLGGASDASFLEGHSYTYEGSIYGRIMNGIITSKCMNPIIYFDELDKISQTAKGEEITNILIHLTDPSQNTHFRDKYFHGIDIDLSKATFIFSFNDPSRVNHILLDRITTVETKYLLVNQKIHIAKNYLLPEIFKDMGMQSNDIIFTDAILQLLIDNYTREGGVRKLKSLLYNIIRECNIANLIKNKLCDDEINYPLTISEKHISIIFKNKHEIIKEKTHTEDKVGIINGLWASTLGNGGLMPIEIKWKPSTNPFNAHATGNLQKVIKESVHIASTLAFDHLDNNLKEEYLEKWKKHPQGLHIHCPDGSVPKEGPSAGTALTVGIYSILTNKKVRHDIAITGEITLQGNVKAIGGLENKLDGAKKGGIKLVLFPKENTKDIEQIVERNPLLFDDNFKAIPIETIEEAFKYSLI